MARKYEPDITQTSGVYYDNTHIAFRAERVEPPNLQCSPRMYRGLRLCGIALQEMELVFLFLILLMNLNHL